jgi:uncharacterized membrane protein YphA (DoxX/SURF4 family)
MSAPRVRAQGALRPLTDNRWVLLVMRIALGGLLITSGATKFHDQEAFRQALLAYGMLPDSLGNLYAAVLPWAEIFIGCCLVLGVFLLFASALTIPLVLSFTIANIYAMVHPIGAAANCSCLGSLVKLSHPVSLAIDLGMLLAAGLLLAGRRRAGALSLGSALDSSKVVSDSKSRITLKVALLAIIVVGIVASVPAETALSRLGVDKALGGGKPVLLLIYSGDEDFRQENRTLLRIQERYAEVYYVPVTYHEARAEAKQLGLDSLPTLLIIAGKSSSGSYVVAATFEGSLDESAVTRVVDGLVGQ